MARLRIAVSNRSEITSYQFRHKGANVPVANHEGHVEAADGETSYLLWVMTGNPGGSMKVEIFNPDGSLHNAREKSTIPSSSSGGFDRLRITR